MTVFVLKNPFSRVPARLFTLGIVPEHLYGSEFGQKPVGCGPFEVVRIASDAITLRGFRRYLRGTPRLDRLSIPLLPVDQVLALMRRRLLDCAALPYSAQLADELQRDAYWTLFPLPAQQPTVLHAQRKDLRERTPNAFDTNWNAHYWYVSA